MPLDSLAILDQFRSELLDRTVPFWLKYGVDWKRGGICTCISDDGRVLSGDKYVWSQLRAIWTFSALYNRIEPKQGYLDVAAQIFDFIKRYGRNDRGEWYFCLDQDGKPLFNGATSIYCDGFAIYGLAEYARATNNREAIDLARQAFANVQPRIALPGSYQTHPLPIPSGAKAHGISMIFSLAFHELGCYLNDSAMIDAGMEHANQVMTVYLHPEHKRLYEFVALDNSLIKTPPGRVVNPGHAIESMWFMIHIFQRAGDRARIRQAIDAIRWHMELGWDDAYGGILLACDAEESFWADKWDTKLWWPHTEALYALLLAYSITREDWCLEWFERVHKYAFGHFPVPNFGEWIQNLDRRGIPLTAPVALPVKDPFHLSRALINSIGVMGSLAKDAPTLN
jgi:N-acylglucosamine 2-epimerase